MKLRERERERWESLVPNLSLISLQQLQGLINLLQLQSTISVIHILYNSPTVNPNKASVPIYAQAANLRPQESYTVALCATTFCIKNVLKCLKISLIPSTRTTMFFPSSQNQPTLKAYSTVMPVANKAMASVITVKPVE